MCGSQEHPYASATGRQDVAILPSQSTTDVTRGLEHDMQIEHKTTVLATPEVLFRIYEDVANWHTWDPDTKHAFLNGPLQPGSHGKLVPAKGNTVPMRVTDVVKDESFTVESKIPLFRMVFEHQLTQRPDGTEVVHRIILSGPLLFILGPMLARRINAGLPVTLKNLKALAEARSAASLSSKTSPHRVDV